MKAIAEAQAPNEARLRVVVAGVTYTLVGEEIDRYHEAIGNGVAPEQALLYAREPYVVVF